MDDIPSNKKKSWWTESFQIEKVDPDTLERRSLFRLNGWKVVVILGIAGILVFSFFYVMMGYTPLRRALPGDYSRLDVPEIVELRERVLEMEDIMVKQDRYIRSMRSLLSGKPIDSLQTNGEEPENEMIPNISESKPEENRWRETPQFKERLEALRHSIRQVGSAGHTPKLDLALIPPVIGPIGKGYDPEVLHYGIDILAPKNTAIKSIADGIVIQADWTVETGNSIMILHPNGMISLYKHNSSLLKNNYEKVKAGEAIAVIGNTGTLTTGPHVHFELWVEGYPEDPSEFINFQ